MRLSYLVPIFCSLLLGCAKPFAPVASVEPDKTAPRLPAPSTTAPQPLTLGHPIPAPAPDAAARSAKRLQEAYQQAYKEMAAMLTDKQPLSFKRAVFLTENAYTGDSLSYEVFNQYIQGLAQVCRNIQRSNATTLIYDKPDRENVARNAAVWLVMTDTVFLDRTDRRKYLMPYAYDFEDFDGAQDWRQMFVTKLLVTRKGNCHSLPILYKLLAEEINAPCWLALAPNHIYLKQQNKKDGWYNTELTAKAFPQDAWLTTSGYVSLETIVNGLYLDTLGPRQNIALCLIDLANGYRRYFTSAADEAFVRQCVTLALETFPMYINALLLDAESRRRLFEANPADATATAMEAAYTRIANTGYREMPTKQYTEWLHALQTERTKRRTFPNSQK